ncbi:hypothetical protein C1H46_031050 [Malus baccata]|uniref:GCK domain-containing protein n=1 Tax=Malus baccata TaxID=106549 RepID=A0A540LAC4_MALBA|nr:hypothetical protein C1H46_031050 [Malus baccata]
MGSVLSSTTENPDPPSSNSTIPIDSQKAGSPPNSSNPHLADSDSKTPDNQNPKHSLDPQLGNKTLEEEKRQEDEGQSENVMEEEEEEEEGECGFCLFMKGGGCKESFIAWEECVRESEKTKEDVVEKCFEVTATLRKCMQVHSDYYLPILKAEEAAEKEVAKELEKEKDSESLEKNATLENTDQKGGSSSAKGDN